MNQPQQTSTNTTPEKPRLMRRPEVETLTGYKCSAIYQKMREGTFPQSVRLSVNRVAWVAAEVHEWLDARIAESRNQKEEV